MPRAPSRIPSPWLVLLPVLVLALLALRAAHNEGEAARTRAAARADAASDRLVRAISGVAQEFAQGLPNADEALTADAALEAARHLYPRWISDPGGRPRAEATETAAGEESAAERTFLTDALDTSGALGDDLAGLAARAAFLEGAAAASPWERVRDVLEVLVSAAQDGADGRAANEGLIEAFEGIASGRTVGDAALRERLLDAVLRDDDDAALREVRDRWDVIRDGVAQAHRDGRPAVRMVPWSGELSILVVAPITLVEGEERTPGCLVGEVPATTVRARIAREAEALVSESSLAAIELLSPSGAPVMAEARPAAGAAQREFAESWASLPTPLEAWRVHAVAPDDGASSPLGTILFGAALVALAAVIWSVLALRRAASEQARLAAERQTFLDHVAHEVRTPAGALLALGEELAAGRVAPQRQATYHAHLAEEARRLARLVEDTLDLSRLDAGRLVLERRAEDLRGIAFGGIEAAGAQDRVTFRAPESPVTVLADASALRRVVRNLVDNSLRHGAAEPRPEVLVAADGAVARVSVRDSGPGIPPDELGRVFERFRRVPSSTHETKGVGVGLAISREIARAHGGDVEVASEPGRGSTFTLRLPAAAGGEG